ncbi:MAG: PqiC family protein [Desulfuromusa sp.]|nr:PqiC family protein [Desulfuromusa sp.]
MMRCIICQSSRWVVIFAVAVLLSGCIGRSSPKVTHFSLLTAEQLNTEQTIASLPEIKLGIGPVTIPDSLKRSQVATRQLGNQYEFDEFNRWAGVLEKDLTYILGDNLGQLLGVSHVGSFPWRQYFKPTYWVRVDFERLDGALAGEAVLSARWSVTDAEGKELLAGGKNDGRQLLDAESFAALIKAESQLVAELSRNIADAIVTLNK